MARQPILGPKHWPMPVHGFARLWQFRIGGGETASSSPAEAGPLWRKPRLARLEAVLYLARQPLSSRKIAQLANLADGNEARTLIRRLRRLYDAGTSAFQVEEVAGGYQLLTRRVLAPWLRRLSQTSLETRLSAPAMETLAVVAYRQPVLRAEIEAIRGVHCDEMLRQLLERDLIRIVARAEDLGRPLLYGTTKRFLVLFGLRHLDELPRAAEFKSTHPEPIHSSELSADIISDRNPGARRTDDTTSTDLNPEEKSVTTRIRSAIIPADLAEEPRSALAPIAQPHRAAKRLEAAKDDDDKDEDEEDEDGEDWDDDDDDEEDEEEEDDLDDDFVDEEWEEVDDDDEEDEEEDDEEDEDWDDDDEEDWDDDDEDEEDEDEEWEENEKE